jgi:hypothetical protein
VWRGRGQIDSKMPQRARPNWSVAGERLLIHSSRTAAGGQTEFPYGCGRVALRA